MMSDGTLNPNPIVHAVQRDVKSGDKDRRMREYDENSADAIDTEEIYELLRHINDPEHPLTLEQLHVIQLDNIHVDDKQNLVVVNFTPTIPHCSMATLIGLMIRVKLLRSLPDRFKVDISVTPGKHASEEAVNKQLNDKERVAAALENAHLLGVVNKGIAHTDKLDLVA
eukprot:GILJ01003974.1.p1 GENE.GILJ01003974.1~~GILJ01003974.1.p1  ORF type:complete len:169 (-),score=25.86 GILJ01003974.1:80-586(-)